MTRSSLCSVLVSAIVASSWSANLFAQPSGRRPSGRDPSAMIARFKSLDKNKDGKVSKAEAQGPPARMFTRLDRNGDGFVDAKELKAMANRGRGESSRVGTGPAVGKPAPDFTLKSLDGKQEVKLSSFAGQRPVALIFGSYT